MHQAHSPHEPTATTTTAPATTTDDDDDHSSPFHPVATAMKAIEPPTTSAAAKGNNSHKNENQGFTKAAGMGALQNMFSSKAPETFEDMYDYECDNSSTSIGFHDHDDELEEDNEGEDDDGKEEEGHDVDRRFHLPSNHPYRLHEQHHYSDDDDDEEEKENVRGGRAAYSSDLHAQHRASLDHSHPAEEGREEVQATTRTTISVTSYCATDNCVSANGMSSSSLRSECSDMSAPGSPHTDAEYVNGSDGIHQNGDDLSTSQPPLAQPHPRQQEQQDIQPGSYCSSAQQTAIDSSTAPLTELNPKNPSRSHLAIPRSIHFLANTTTDRSPASGAASPLGRLQIHTVNRLEVENSFLLSQNNSLTRDIQHCRQTVQALKQILAQREDTIGRVRQEVHQAHLKIKFMESLLSGQRHHIGQPQQQQQQLPYQQQQQLPYQQQQQYQQGLQQKGLEGDWKERHRLDDDDDEEDDDDDEYDDEDEEVVEGEEEGGVVTREEEERGSSSLLDMYAQGSEPPFDWLLKGWDEGEMPPVEGDSDIEHGHGQGENEQDDNEEEEEAREIPRPVRSIFSGVNDDEQYNSDEYIDDDDDEEEDEDEEDEGDFREGKKPRSGDLEHRMQGAGIYLHQRSHSGEASALALSMSLSNNSTCILSQCGSSDHNDDDDSDEDDEGLDDPCGANEMVTAANGDRVSGCAIITGNRPQSPVPLPSPALSESSMSLGSHSEGSNGSVTSLSCSSLTSNSSADEKGGSVLESQQHQQQQQQQLGGSSSSSSSSSVEVLVSSAGAGDNGRETDQQGLQLPTVVPYSSFRDSGHFPTQVFTMDFEEQHLVVVDDVDTDEEEDKDEDDHDEDVQESQPFFRPFSPTTTASFLIHNTDSDPTSTTSSAPSSPTTSKKGGLATLAAVLFKTKDTPHQAMPLCQPNGSHPCLGTSPPMAVPLALISRVNIEASASSTTLVSASAPSPMAANKAIPILSEGSSRARPLSVATTTTATTTAGEPGIADWEPNAFYRDLETVANSSNSGNAAMDPNEHASEKSSASTLPAPKDIVATTVQDDNSGGDGAIKFEDPGSNPVSPTTGTTWGRSSLFKALRPSRRKSKLRSAKSKDKIDLGCGEARDAVLPGGEVITIVATAGKEVDEAVVVVAKEQSVAWTMLKSQAPLSVVTAGAGRAQQQQELQQQPPMVSESVSPTSPSILFSRVFGRGGSSSGGRAKA
ncbi:hypothetical protein BGW39_011685 [Mortierella sp. 14UC]|nr:hypothetical protein BGW39_011685 [Mortierella sp. 14UC]